MKESRTSWTLTLKQTGSKKRAISLELLEDAMETVVEWLKENKHECGVRDSLYAFLLDAGCAPLQTYKAELRLDIEARTFEEADALAGKAADLVGYGCEVYDIYEY